jgi:chloramphenicol-sensitive protein RarD
MKNRYYIAALAAFVIWGFFSLALKPIAAYASLDILFYRVFLAATMMLVILVAMGRKFREENKARFFALRLQEKRKTVLSTFLGGALLTGNWYFFIYAMNNISIKSASYAYLVCPILTTVLAYFILKEKLSRLQWASVVLSAASCAVLSFHNVRDLMYSLVVAFSYAFYLISQRNNDKVDKLVILAFQMVFSALILLPFYPFFAAPLPVDTHFYLFIAIIALGFTIIPLFLNLYALKGMNSSTMGILLYINPVLNFVVARIFFHEPTTQIQLLSYGLILLSILLFNYEALRPKRAKEEMNKSN